MIKPPEKAKKWDEALDGRLTGQEDPVELIEDYRERMETGMGTIRIIGCLITALAIMWIVARL
jgi:hypothetical protein